MAGRIFGIRRTLTATGRTRGTTASVALLVGGLGLVLALFGQWLFAAIAAVVAVTTGWLAGLWFGPRTADGYLTAMRHLWEAWIAEVQYAGREARARRTKAVGAFEKVTPPAGWLDRHARLVTELDVVAGDAPIADRVRALGQLDALIAELQQDLSESAQASYLAQARHLHGDLAYAASDANRRVQTATARSGRKLARMWRPAGVAAEHDALMTLLAEYGSLQQAFHDAITARDDAAAATANAAFQGLRPEIEQAWGRLREATRVKDRWVLPEQPSRSA